MIASDLTLLFPSLSFAKCLLQGKPDAAAWLAAAQELGRTGHDYIITGQPTRSCSWDSYQTGFTCNGLGYLHTRETIDSSNWNSLVDGNEADRRSWPSANSVNVHKLPSLCTRLGDVPGVELWADHIWRLRKNR